MRIRGVIEGFYGAPWTHEERLDLIRFCGTEGLNTWVHAPKDDPYHRARWRELYPEDELARFVELASEAAQNGVDFAYAIAPGLDLDYADDGELATLLAKLDQLRSAGIESFQLLWDDIESRACAEQAAFSKGDENGLAVPAGKSSRSGFDLVEVQFIFGIGQGAQFGRIHFEFYRGKGAQPTAAVSEDD